VRAARLFWRTVLEERFGGTPYGWNRDMLRLILATLFRAGEIEVTYQGNRFHNYQDPASHAVVWSCRRWRIRSNTDSPFSSTAIASPSTTHGLAGNAAIRLYNEGKRLAKSYPLRVNSRTPLASLRAMVRTPPVSGPRD
jgi:hypothetical protein